MNRSAGSSGTYEVSTCTNQLCVQFRTQHGIITQKRNELQKELETVRDQHTRLYDQVVTHGKESMIREAATGESGVRLPNGELMTVEKFMTRTKMMNQCRESLQVSEKRARQFGEDNEKLKHERDTLYTKMRKYEDMLQGFDRARHHDVFSDENHRKTLSENAMLVEEVEQLSSNERELKEENRILRRRMQAMIAERRKRKTEEPVSCDESISPARKRNDRAQQRGRRVIGSDDDEDDEIEKESDE